MYISELILMLMQQLQLEFWRSILLPCASFGAKHRFSNAYAPWSKGTVESVCKEVLRIMRAFNTEMKKPEVDWPYSTHRNEIRKSSINCSFWSENSKNVQETLSASRKKAIERHNSKTHINRYNPIVGDYVVVARIFGPRTKMSANWVGPRRITRIISDFTVEVEHLLQNWLHRWSRTSLTKFNESSPRLPNSTLCWFANCNSCTNKRSRKIHRSSVVICGHKLKTFVKLRMFSKS